MLMSKANGAIDAPTLRQMFETMTKIKLCDERFRTMLSSGQFFIIYYSPRGQEVISAAIGANLRADDYMVTTYRGLHDQLAKGVPLRGLWAEFLGRADGTCKGKGGPMHITDPDCGLMVTTGIVGAGLPIAGGLGLAAKLAEREQVAVVNFGDGASNIGAFHEALNLASVWQLPVIFVCQNNLYSEHTRFQDGTSVDSIATRAAAYGMVGERVDGNDPLEMHRAARDAVERARAGQGPTLLECITFRFHGHLFGDAMEYMPEEERAAAMEADPVPRFRQWLIDNGHLTEAAVEEIEASITAEIDDAVAFAQASPAPSPEELYTDVYAEVTR
jgi:pyruvate dehydrogenase E1 component alpha subunit